MSIEERCRALLHVRGLCHVNQPMEEEEEACTPARLPQGRERDTHVSLSLSFSLSRKRELVGRVGSLPPGNAVTSL